MEYDFKSIGFPYPKDIIMSFIGGSQLHGAKLDGTDDTDYYGVFIEPPVKVLGLDSFEHFVYSTSGNDKKNTTDDIDVCLYSLKKLATLICKGNPSVLHFLFAQTEYRAREWDCFVWNKSLFLAKSYLDAFFGYANAQLQRLYNGRGPKDINRAFLESQHGYDTKYAMHIIRLLDEGLELMETGNITLPRPNATLLKAIRKGEYKLYELEKWADELQKRALKARENSLLPDFPDKKKISEIVAKIYLDHWRNNEKSK